MAITFGRDNLGRSWDDSNNNEPFVEVPGNRDNWFDKGKKMRANESNIETIILMIPIDVGSIEGDGVDAVVDSIKKGTVDVVKGIHADKWSSHLGKHITVQLGAPYLDTYHLYGKYYPAKLRWIVTYISKGMPLKMNY